MFSGSCGSVGIALDDPYDGPADAEDRAGRDQLASCVSKPFSSQAMIEKIQELLKACSSRRSLTRSERDEMKNKSRCDAAALV